MEKRRALFVNYLYYFLSGCCCLLIGSSLTQLIVFYGEPIERVILLGSSVAIGRVVSVRMVASQIEKRGPIPAIISGCICFSVFMLGIPLFRSFPIQLVLSFFGGITLAIEDTAAPALFSAVDKENYSTHMSAGQAAFGLGSFFIPFMISVMLKGGRPFYMAYYLIALLPLSIIILSVGLQTGHTEAATEKPAPIYVKSMTLAAIAIGIIMATYNSVFSSLCTYTTSLGISAGMSEADASMLLTVFNIGGIIGAVLFSFLMKKLKEINVLIMNLAICLIILFTVLRMKNVALCYILFLVEGVFVEVLFGIIFTIATRIGYQKMEKASSLTSMVAGISDIVTPLIAGRIIPLYGITGIFQYIMIVMAVCLFTAVLLRSNIRTESGNNT